MNDVRMVVSPSVVKRGWDDVKKWLEVCISVVGDGVVVRV